MDSYFANEEYCSEDSTLPAEQYTPPPTCSIEETGRWKMESYCHLVDGRWNRTVIWKMEDLLMRNCPLEGRLQQQLSVVESVGTGASFRSIKSPDKFLAPAVKQTVRYLQQIAIQYCQVLYDD